MSLTEKEIRKIAKLSRIKLQEGEIAHFQQELSGILDWVTMLQEVNTDNVAPMSSVADASLPFREDEVTEKNIRDDILKNAPESQYGFFVVPKVVE